MECSAGQPPDVQDPLQGRYTAGSHCGGCQGGGVKLTIEIDLGQLPDPKGEELGRILRYWGGAAKHSTSQPRSNNRFSTRRITRWACSESPDCLRSAFGVPGTPARHKPWRKDRRGLRITRFPVEGPDRLRRLRAWGVGRQHAVARRAAEARHPPPASARSLSGG
jgi:hypothetical protein